MKEHKPCVEDYKYYVASVELASYCCTTNKRLIALIRVYDMGVKFQVSGTGAETKTFDILSDAIDYYNSI
jgi:hypothetical protein